MCKSFFFLLLPFACGVLSLWIMFPEKLRRIVYGRRKNERRGETGKDTHRYLNLCGAAPRTEQVEGLCISGFEMHLKITHSHALVLKRRWRTVRDLSYHDCWPQLFVTLAVGPEALKHGPSFRYQRTRAVLNMQLFFTLSYHLGVRGPGHVSLGQP